MRTTLIDLWDRLSPATRATIRTLVTIALNGGGMAISAMYVDPVHFSGHDLMHVAAVFGLGAAVGVINWLRKQPWAAAQEDVVNIAKLGVVILAVTLGAGLLTGCAAKQYHTAVVADQTLSSAIFALQDAELAAHTAKLIPDAKHAQYKATIKKLLVAGDDLTVALQHWQPGTPAPAIVATAFADVSALLKDAGAIVPAADPFLAKIQAVLDGLKAFGVIPSGSAANGAARATRQFGRADWKVSSLGRQVDPMAVIGMERTECVAVGTAHNWHLDVLPKQAAIVQRT